jgi:hypothetical protein
MTQSTPATPDYSFDLDRRKGLIRVVVRGLWDAETVKRFFADVLAATEDMRRTHSSHDTLVDARDFPVQPARITDGIAGLMQMGMEVNDGRTAVISHSHLGKMQGDRLNPDPRLKIFLVEADAVAWLAEPQSPATD